MAPFDTISTAVVAPGNPARLGMIGERLTGVHRFTASPFTIPTQRLRQANNRHTTDSIGSVLSNAEVMAGHPNYFEAGEIIMVCHVRAPTG